MVSTSGIGMGSDILFSTPVRKNAPTPDMVTTPFRTPKSVRGKRNIQENNNAERILGTPDYLAPELLLRLPHSYGVDWWGLGVCLYEFMTGIPPFTDETPDAIFHNILTRDMSWPEGSEALSSDAVRAIELLLTLDPVKRARAPDIRKMGLFTSLLATDTDLLSTTAPFIPQPDDPADTTYFEARNNAQNLRMSAFEV